MGNDICQYIVILDDPNIFYEIYNESKLIELLRRIDLDRIRSIQYVTDMRTYSSDSRILIYCKNDSKYQHEFYNMFGDDPKKSEIYDLLNRRMILK